MEEYLPQLSMPARRWLRFFGLLAAIVLVVWIVIALGEVFTPIAVALAIAYILNPLITWCERRGARRLFMVTAIYVSGAILLVFAGTLFVGQLLDQIDGFGRALPSYVATLENTIQYVEERYLPPASQPAPPASAPAATSAPALSTLPADAATTAPSTQPARESPFAHLRAWALKLGQDYGVSAAQSTFRWTQSALSDLVNLISFLVLVPLYTFFFLWKFDAILRAIYAHLPHTPRDTIVRIAKTIDNAVADFFRGRLILCLILSVLSATGWTLVGVPYGILLGTLAGLFNLIPFASVLVLLPALLLTYLDVSQSGAPVLWPLVWVLVIHVGLQALESFLLSPLIEGRYNGLHPITTVIALLIGGKVAGLLGVLLAIPVTSTLKTLAAEWILPELRRLAAPPAAPGAGALASPHPQSAPPAGPAPGPQAPQKKKKRGRP